MSFGSNIAQAANNGSGVHHAFSMNQFMRWVEKEGWIAIPLNVLHPPRCQFTGCSMNEEKGAKFGPHHSIRLVKVDEVIVVRGIKKSLTTFIVCCALHVWEKRADWHVEFIGGRPSEFIHLVAKPLGYQLEKRTSEKTAPRSLKKKKMGYTRMRKTHRVASVR